MTEDNKYPLASFCLVTYNQEKYIAESLQGAFNQDYPNLEIIISDDCSKDRTFEIIKEMVGAYKGSHKIVINRNEPNIGPRENFNKSFYELSKGEYIIVAAGDDISAPNRTSYCVEFMEKNPQIMSLSCASQFIDENGCKMDNPITYRISDGCNSILTLADFVTFDDFRIFSGDSRVLRRKVIDSFPPLKYTFAEDIYYFIRSIYIGPIAFIRKPLSFYRQHSQSIMGGERKKVKVTESDILRFETSTAKQLREDYQYALEYGCFEKEDAIYVRNKIEKVIYWLKPKQPSPKYQSFALRLTRKLHSICNHGFEIIERNLQWTNHS